jgi:hypothetical protein
VMDHCGASLNRSLTNQAGKPRDSCLRDAAVARFCCSSAYSAKKSGAREVASPTKPAATDGRSASCRATRRPRIMVGVIHQNVSLDRKPACVRGTAPDGTAMCRNYGSPRFRSVRAGRTEYTARTRKTRLRSWQTECCSYQRREEGIGINQSFM